MTRQHKTPKQRAEEALAVEERRVRKLTKKVAALRAELETVEDEWHTAQTRHNYLKQHPDLKPTPGTNTTTSTPDRSTTA